MAPGVHLYMAQPAKPKGAITRMNRRRRLIILMIVLAVAIPVGLDSMGKVFAGAGVGPKLSNPTQPSNDSDTSGGGNYGLLRAARHFLTHKQTPPDGNSLGGESNGNRFQEANNNPSGHGDAPWLDGNYPVELWHSDNFNSIGLPGNSPEGGNSGNGNGNGGDSPAPGFGGPTGGGTMLPGGPHNGNSGTSNSNTPSTSGITDTTATAPTATPEPGSLLLFATGIGLIVAGSRLRRSWLPQAPQN